MPTFAAIVLGRVHLSYVHTIATARRSTVRRTRHRTDFRSTRRFVKPSFDVYSASCDRAQIHTPVFTVPGVFGHASEPNIVRIHCAFHALKTYLTHRIQTFAAVCSSSNL